MKEKKKTERKDYEIRAEIIVKRLQARILEMEAKAMEAKQNTEGNINELEEKINSLVDQRKELNQKFDELKGSSKDKWDKLVIEFENFLAHVNADKQEFYEKAELWIQDAAERIDELEEKAKHASEDLKIKINDQVGHIKEYKESLEVKFSELKKSQGENWHKVKDGFEENLSKVKESINKAFDYISK